MKKRLKFALFALNSQSGIAMTTSKKRWSAKTKDIIEVVAVDSLDEVMKHALIKHEHKESLVERLSSVIDILTPEVSEKSPSA